MTHEQIGAAGGPLILILTPILDSVIRGCEALGPCVLVGPDDDLVDMLAKASGQPRAVAVWNRSVSGAMMEQLPALEIIANFGVGYDKVDVGTAVARNVIVTNSPGVLTEEMADFTIGLLIMTVRRLGEAERYLRAGNWSNGNFPLPASLRDRSIGILGIGRIGRAVAKRLEAFDLDISYCSRKQEPNLDYRYYADPVELARNVDTLISMLPGAPETRHLVGARLLAALGENAILINVGRGSSVDKNALIEALRMRTILGAGLDVFEREPNPSAELLTLENVVLLPHVGTGSMHTRAAMGQVVVGNLAAWFREGRVLTPVSETSFLNGTRRSSEL